MNGSRLLFYALRVALFSVTHCALVDAASLRTPFIDVYQTDIPVGKKTSVTSVSGDGLFLNNPGAQTVRVTIRLRAPLSAELLPDASPVPRSEWVIAQDSFVSIPARGSVRVPLWIHVPAEQRFRRKTFQVMIDSTLVPDPGKAMAVHAGLTSRLRFTTR